MLRARIGDTLQEGAVVADLHGGDASDAAVLDALVTGQERTFQQDPLFAFRLLADIGLRALSPAINDPATAVQVLDTIQGLLLPLVVRDLDVAEVADDAGAVKAVLALPSWDDYLRTALDDLIESGSRSPMMLLQAQALLTGLLNAAPPQRRSSITWRLHRAEELAAGNFPAIWRHAAGGDPAMSRPRSGAFHGPDERLGGDFGDRLRIAAPAREVGTDREQNRGDYLTEALSGTARRREGPRDIERGQLRWR